MRFSTWQGPQLLPVLFCQYWSYCYKEYNRWKCDASKEHWRCNIFLVDQNSSCPASKTDCILFETFALFIDQTLNSGFFVSCMKWTVQYSMDFFRKLFLNSGFTVCFILVQQGSLFKNKHIILHFWYCFLSSWSLTNMD